MVLDTGPYEYNDTLGTSNGGDILILPLGGGKLGIGRNDPNTTVDISGDVSFNGSIYLRDQIGIGMQPVDSFRLSIANGDISFENNLYVHGDVSFSQNLYIKESVGIGRVVDSTYDLAVQGKVYIQNISLLPNETVIKHLNNRLAGIVGKGLFFLVF